MPDNNNGCSYWINSIKEKTMIYYEMCNSIALIVVTFQRQVTDKAILSALTVQVVILRGIMKWKFCFSLKTVKECNNCCFVYLLTLILPTCLLHLI
jgi:hypothetical protein